MKQFIFRTRLILGLLFGVGTILIIPAIAVCAAVILCGTNRDLTRKETCIFFLGIPVSLVAVAMGGLSVSFWILPLRLPQLVGLIKVRFFPVKEAVVSRFNSEWEEKNSDNRCGHCNNYFDEHNPDAGGGMCQQCWTQSH